LSVVCNGRRACAAPRSIFSVRGVPYLLQSTAVILKQIAKTQTVIELKNKPFDNDVRRQQIIHYCQYDNLIFEAATQLCTQLCANIPSNRPTYKSAQLVMDVLHYLFHTNFENIMFGGCTTIVVGSCTLCDSKISHCYQTNLSKFVIHSLSVPFAGLSQHTFQDIFTPCCQSDYYNYTSAVAAFPTNLLLKCNSDELIDNTFTATTNELQLVYACEYAMYECLGVFKFDETTGAITYHSVDTNVKCDNCFLLLQLRHRTNEPVIITKAPKHSTDDSRPTILYYTATQTAVIKSKHLKTNLINLIIGGKQDGWFSSSLIDSYMHLLCNTHYAKVHAVCSSWVGQRLFTADGKPLSSISAVESTRLQWFDYNYILIPVNVNNNHWILYVLAVSENKLYVCDSMNGTYPYYNNQIARYIAIEYFRKFGTNIDYNSFSKYIYASQTGFPTQQDSHSCGPYVCMMAKAIVHQMQFSFRAHDARQTIVQELNFLKLHCVPSWEDKLKSHNFSHTPLFDIHTYMPPNFQRLVNDDMKHTIIAFSHSDEQILRDNYFDQDKTIVVMDYSTSAKNISNLNEYGIQLKQSVNPNIFNFLIENDRIADDLITQSPK
jgi:hypothetical protein